MISGLTIFPFRANWSKPITLKSTFATNVKRESIPGSITRDSARDYGQRSIKFNILPYNDGGAGVPACVRDSWDAFREANPPGTILGIPLWSEEGIYLTADAAIGATTLSLSAVNFVDWRGEAVLWPFGSGAGVSPAVVEGVTIASISGAMINLSSALTIAFKAGDQFLPLMRGFQIDDYAERVLSPEISELVLEFVEDLAHIGAYAVPGTVNAVSYLGIPVLPLIAEWSEPPTVGITQGTHVVSQGINRQALATLRQYVRQRLSYRVGCDGRQDRATIWEFFHDRRGRWDRFWLPSFKDELKLSADVGATDTFLTLENFADYSSRFNLGGDLRVSIFITDGFNFWIRQVKSLSTDNSNKVTIDFAIGSPLSASATMIGLLPLVQFATDDIEIECQSPLVATATLAFTELEREYVEVDATSWPPVGGTAGGTGTGGLNNAPPPPATPCSNFDSGTTPSQLLIHVKIQGPPPGVCTAYEVGNTLKMVYQNVPGDFDANGLFEHDLVATQVSGSPCVYETATADYFGGGGAVYMAAQTYSDNHCGTGGGIGATVNGFFRLTKQATSMLIQWVVVGSPTHIIRDQTFTCTSDGNALNGVGGQLANEYSYEQLFSLVLSTFTVEIVQP